MKETDYPFLTDCPRITVVGTTGSGKTTTAARLAQILNIPLIELDSLHWGPNWQERPKAEFQKKVAQALNFPAWVVDGNYSEVHPLTWGQATTLVWLDYDLPVILGQLLWRTLKRVTVHEKLWNNNYETWRGTFFSRDSLFFYIFPSRKRQHATYPQILRQPEYAHLQVLRLRSRRQTARWLSYVQESKKTGNRIL